MFLHQFPNHDIYDMDIYDFFTCHIVTFTTYKSSIYDDTFFDTMESARLSLPLGHHDGVWSWMTTNMPSTASPQVNNRIAATMRGLVPFMVFILLISLDYSTGAAPSYNGTLYQGDIMLTDDERRSIFGDDDGITQHSGAAPSYNGTLYQGDIMLTDDERRSIFGDDDGITQHSAKEGREWPNGEIPYVISGRRFSNRDKNKIKNAMKEFEDKTCITFVPKRRTDKYYINIKHDRGCSSFVGRIPEGVWINGIRYDPRYGQPVQLERDGCMSDGT